MNHETHEMIKPEGESLFVRIISILEQARGNVVRSVNANMVLAYWLIGREIVQELQGGEERAEYGKQVLETLSARLAERYGKGFSVPNLQNFRKFYQTFPERLSIPYPAGTKFVQTTGHPVGDESERDEKRYPAGTELAESATLQHREIDSIAGFSPQLSWSHYRALMRVKDDEARAFYEQEAVDCGWSKAQLERQIQSSYYQRIIANRGKGGLVATDRERLQGEPVPVEQLLKSPYVLEFLGLPDTPGLHEDALVLLSANPLTLYIQLVVHIVKKGSVVS